jgi:RNA polymerase sigma-70 factor, ECF subfamily
MSATAGEITDLLRKIREGDPEAEGCLWERLYPELHRIAARYCRNERPEHTLSPTALINEAYVELIGQSDKRWQNRAHFMAVAAQVMRRVLVDYARRHRAGKRAAAHPRVSLDEELTLAPEAAEQILIVDEALTRLASLDSRLSRIVELRFFGGFSEKETADLLGVGVRTVTRGWSMAKAWLYTELRAHGGSG